MPYTFEDIYKITGGTLLNSVLQPYPVSQLLYDSRRLSRARQSIFFALKGQRQNGHDFIADLYKTGVRNFIISQRVSAQDYPEANLLLVDAPLRALQQIAKAHRQQFDIPVIGITGSNGKTIIKEWLHQLLVADYPVIRSPRSYNSQLGVPLSVWQMNQEHRLAIFEAGISTTQEMEYLAPIIDCSIGLLSHIGDAHDEGFQSREEKIREKLKLFAKSEVFLYRCDDPLVDRLVKEQINCRQISWSAQQAADLQIKSILPQTNRQALVKALYQDQFYTLNIPFTDPASIENIIYCWLVMLYLDYDHTTIQQRVQQLQPIAMRLELKAAINNCILINDSYNSDFTSLENALSFVEQQDHSGQRTIILSDILESGQEDHHLYASVARLLTEKNINRLFGIGPAISMMKEIFPDSIDVNLYPDTSALLATLPAIPFQDEVILLKGARRFAFEKIATQLERKAHSTALEINLTALTHNLQVYSKLLRPETLLMVMVKASAYGSGSTELARLLEQQAVDYLAVAYTDEGVELRQAGINLPILVLNPEENSFPAILQYQLEPEIYSLSQARNLLRLLPANRPCNIHIKLNTGMNRLGFDLPDLPALATLIADHSQLRVKSIFSHLAASDDPAHDAFTHQQFALFDKMYTHLCKDLPSPPLRHLLNTGGIARFPQYQMEMVRLGIGLYGIDHSGLLKDQLIPVHRLISTLSQIRMVKANESIGYNRSGKALTDKRIGIINIGYADGLPRAAGNGKYTVLVAGKQAPIIGNICMDMCMIDLTEIPAAQEGDEVLIFGKEQPIEHLANCLHTIPYEIFTNISERVRRIYFQE